MADLHRQATLLAGLAWAAMPLILIFQRVRNK